MVKQSNASVYVGLSLLFLYLLYYFSGFRFDFLVEWQSIQSYKRWSGFALALLFLLQWILTIVRVIKGLKKYSLKMTALHKWLGAISPILFFFHATYLGYGYQLVLSSLFLINVLLGNINLDFIKSTNEYVFRFWMIVHVSISVILTGLMLFHLGVVFYYK